MCIRDRKTPASDPCEKNNYRGPALEAAQAALAAATLVLVTLAFTRFSLQRLSTFFASYSLWALYILENILEY